MSWRSIQSVNDDIATFFGLLFNFVTFFLAWTVQYKDLRQYRRITCQTCTIDIVLIVLTFVLKPIKIVYFGREYLITNGYLESLPISVCQWLFTLWFFALYFSITSVPVGFIYRYIVVCHGRPFTILHQLLCLGASFVASFAFCVVAHWIYFVKGHDYVTMAAELPHFIQDAKGVTRAVGMMFPNTRYSYIIVISVTFLAVSSYSVVIVCAYRIYRFLKQNPQPSQKFTEVQKQLNLLLAVHAIVPLFSAVLPSVELAAAIMAIDCDFSLVTLFTAITFSWIPTANAVTLVLIVKPYRQQLIEIFKRKLKIRRNTLVLIGPIR